MKEKIADLGDGLVLRLCEKEDAESVAEMFGWAFAKPEATEPNQEFLKWITPMVKGDNPYIGPEMVSVVEDTHKKKIVSGIAWFRQTWTYEEVVFVVGRPEPVATLKEYRNRGLVRKQFEYWHKAGLEAGEHVQAITGLPYYYGLDLAWYHWRHLLKMDRNHSAFGLLTSVMYHI